MSNPPYVHITEAVSRQAPKFPQAPKDPALNPEFPDSTDAATWECEEPKAR
jgi:hypothetical protein